MNLFSLRDKVAMVTGAAQGLGAAISEGFAEAGASVVLVDIQDPGRTAALIGERTKATTATFVADVSDEQAIEGVVRSVAAQFGHIDILVNNAGITIHHAVPTTRIDLDEHFWPVLRVNLAGPLICAKHVVRHMIGKGIRGCIINTSSLHGIRPSSNAIQQGYYASKAGLINLTRAWALELARYGIRVNSVAPGLFRTAISKVWFENPQTYEWTRARIPIGRGAEPDEIKGVYVFLASEAASFMTGQTVVVDGGVEAALWYDGYYHAQT